MLFQVIAWGSIEPFQRLEASWLAGVAQRFLFDPAVLSSAADFNDLFDASFASVSDEQLAHLTPAFDAQSPSEGANAAVL